MITPLSEIKSQVKNKLNFTLDENTLDTICVHIYNSINKDDGAHIKIQEKPKVHDLLKRFKNPDIKIDFASSLFREIMTKKQLDESAENIRENIMNKTVDDWRLKADGTLEIDMI